MNKTALIILDGWGIGDQTARDAVNAAKTPVFDRLVAQYPTSNLVTFGKDVGLPEGQMGNSEVGHLNIGAGRIVMQDLVRINYAVEHDELRQNAVLQETFEYAKSGKRKLHLIGLIGEGGVHAQQNHLHHLIELAAENGIRPFIHAFTDGRDSSPTAGLESLRKLLSHAAKTKSQVATVIGRYYAMDRDKRWERIKRAYDLLVSAKGITSESLEEGMKAQYENGVTDEFMEPLLAADINGKIEVGDAVICFNFRTDRCREITHVLTQQPMPEIGTSPLALRFVTMTRYDEHFKNVGVLFDKQNLKNTLGEVVSSAGGKQLRIAETEKYPHVTFFFSGGREDVFVGEVRKLINSPKVATYDLQPEMSARQVTREVVDALQKEQPDFVCLNFANPDMVGHTGVFDAIVKAVECVDDCLGQVIDCGLRQGYRFLILADHGNAEQTLTDEGKPHTAHTINLVPCIAVGDLPASNLNDGRLADVAPTVLALMGLVQPEEMTGKNLFG